jgi:hypothetical protein
MDEIARAAGPRRVGRVKRAGPVRIDRKAGQTGTTDKELKVFDGAHDWAALWAEGRDAKPPRQPKRKRKRGGRASAPVPETAPGAAADPLADMRGRIGEAVERIGRRVEHKVARLAADLARGAADPARVQAGLSARFGKSADGIVSADGGLDTFRLTELLARGAMRQLRERIDAYRERRDPMTDRALDHDAAPEPGSVVSVDA